MFSVIFYRIGKSQGKSVYPQVQCRNETQHWLCNETRGGKTLVLNAPEALFIYFVAILGVPEFQEKDFARPARRPRPSGMLASR